MIHARKPTASVAVTTCTCTAVTVCPLVVHLRFISAISGADLGYPGSDRASTCRNGVQPYNQGTCLPAPCCLIRVMRQHYCVLASDGLHNEVQNFFGKRILMPECSAVGLPTPVWAMGTRILWEPGRNPTPCSLSQQQPSA